MTEEKKVELRDEELESVSGGMRILVGGADDAKDLYRVVSVGEVPVVGKRVVIHVGGPEFTVRTDADGYVRLPPFHGTRQVEFQKAQVGFPDDPCKG